MNLTSSTAYQKKRNYWWILWVILGLLVILMGGCVISLLSAGMKGISKYAGATQSDTIFEETWGADLQTHDKIAIIEIEGVISGSKDYFEDSMADKAIKHLKTATEDPDVKGILLHLNTPGGEVTASDKIYNAAKCFAKTGRPVFAYMDTVAASGGYYIACAAENIFATETTITGSIGVIIGGINGTELLKKVGLKSQTFTSGAFKDTLSMTREMREDEREYIQGLVDATYAKFASIVSTARNIPMQELQSGIADGRIFHGLQAKQVGLVDETGYLQDAIDALKVKIGLSQVQVVRYKSEPSFSDLFGLLNLKTTRSVKVDWGQGMLGSTLKPYIPYAILEGY